MPVDMWRWVVAAAALLAAAAAAAAGAVCPPRCECAVADELQYECRDNGTSLYMSATLNDRVFLRCEGEDPPCALVPRVAAAGAGGLLPRLAAQRCSPAVLPCLRAAAAAAAVDTLLLRDPRAPLLPEHVAGMQLTTLLIYDAYSVSSIPSAALAAVPTLRALRVNEARALRLAGGALAAAPALRYLELSAAGLRDLPRAALAGLPRLQQLQLWKNRIHTLQPDSFEGLESLEELNLKENQLAALPAGVFGPTPRLRVLHLQMNSFGRLGPGVFSGTQLENITLHDNRVNLTLESLTFANMTSLRHLLLHYSHIQSVPADLLRGSGNLTSLDLSHNGLAQLPDTLFQGLAALATLDLSYNKILELPPALFLPLKGLVELNLNRNLIQVLPDQLFSGLGSFRRFTIDDNQLHTISRQAFLGAQSLYNVSLARNRLSLRQEGYQSFEQSSPFQYLVNARALVLQGNLVDQFFADWTSVLTQLTSLDLSYNNLTDLVIEDLEFLSDKNVVDLRHNNISAIIFSSLLWAAPAPGRAARSTVLLDGNPLRCDCLAYPLARLLRGAALLYTTPRFELGAAACAAPRALRGRRLARLAPERLACELPGAACPAACGACASRPATDTLELTCDRLPKKLPIPTEFGASSIKLKLSDISELGRLPVTVRSLDLSGLGLRELKLMRQPHLKELDLRNNLLKTVPDYILESDLALYLSNNSLECECEYTNYIKAIISRKNINDISNITCPDGRRVRDVDVEGLCAVRDASLVGGGVFLVLIVVAIGLSILVYSYHYEILVYLSSRGYLKWIVTEDVTDSDKLYDVFVAFSHSDFPFIQDELLPRLEGDFKLKTCVHYRDWVVGDMIPTQVVRSVQQSRKTLVVLSKHFVKSAWAGMEFRTAHCLALKEGRARLVIVTLDEEVVHEPALDQELRAYLATNTYLERRDDRFWERLRRAVAPRDRRFTLLRQLRRGAGGKRAGAGAGAGGALDSQLNSAGQLVNAAFEKDAV